MRTSCGLRLFAGLLYPKKYNPLLKVHVRDHVSVGNVTPSKITCPQSVLAFRSCMSSTNNKWTGDDNMRVCRAFKRFHYARRVKAAVRVGAPYPEQNPQLANLIEEIKRHDLNIPLEKVTKIALNPKCRTGIHEVVGPHGILLIVQYDTNDISNAEHLVKDMCSKYDLSCLKVQSQRLAFYDQKGMLMAAAGRGMSSEEAIEAATKAGAELVSAKLDSDEKISLEIYCNPSNLHQLKRQLKDFIITEAFVGYIPKRLAEVPDSLKSKMVDVIVDFSEMPEIEMVFENIK